MKKSFFQIIFFLFISFTITAKAQEEHPAKPNQLLLSNTYPNPAASILHLTVYSPNDMHVQLVVLDMSGHILINQNTAALTGENDLQITVSALKPGMYLIKAICMDGCETTVRRFIKQ
jgi:hypothetical protein